MAKKLTGTPLTQLFGTCDRVVEWLERMATADMQQYESCRRDFPAFADSCLRSAKNFRATGRDVKQAVEAAREYVGKAGQ